MRQFAVSFGNKGTCLIHQEVSGNEDLHDKTNIVKC